jgi:peptidylprolyl isomerase
VRGGLTPLVACFALAVFPLGCGGGEAKSSASTTKAASATTATTDAPPRPTLAPLRWRQPALDPHPGYSVDRVVVRDIARGTGPRVGIHDYVLMDYIEGDYRRGDVFYDAWEEPGPPAGVILARIERWRGLTIGMRGMRVGGRRQIIVPPRLGGTDGYGHLDWRNYLIFDVALRGIYARGCADDGEPCRSGP